MPGFDDLNPDQQQQPGLGDDNPLGDIDPMAWLESLAARQGATEGFTTSHDMDIPEIDPSSVVIDEPGYTPYELGGSQKPAASQPAAAVPQPEPQPLAPEPAAQPMAASSDDFSLPPGVDPLKWLESLAARQGATEGFTTSADMEIEEIDPSTVHIDEPGYTPSETIRSRHQPPAQPPAEPVKPAAVVPEPEPEPQESIQEVYAQEPEPAQPMAMGSDFSLPPGVDPLKWLESLAARQGATEGFTTSADMEIEEIDPSTVHIDEPGYTPSETIRSRHQPPAEPAKPAAPPAPEPAFAQASEPVSATEDFLSSLIEPDLEGVQLEFAESGDTMDWLDSLVEDSAQVGAADLFELSEQEPLGFEEEALPATHTPEQVLASIDGLSDDEIARLQAQNRLSPEQELAWLQRQAMRAHENRMALEAEDEDELFEVEGEMELGTAEAGELPPWLQNVTIAEKEEEELSLTFTDDIELPPQPEGLPDWLREEASPQADLELPEFTLESTEPAYEEVPTQPAEVDLGFLNLESYDPAQDEWASALDEEHDRMVSGMDEEQPEWFSNAMQQVAAEDDIVSGLAGIEPEPESVFEPEMITPVDEQITPGGDLPDWLAQVADTPIEAAADVPEDLPDWLRPVAEAGAPSDDLGIDEWLRQEESSRRIEVPAGVVAAATALPAAEEEELPMADTGPLPAWVSAEAQAPVSPQPRVETPQPTPTAARPQPAATPAAQPQPPRQAPRPAAPPPQPRQRVAISNEPVPAPRALAPLPSRDNPNYGYYVAQLEANSEDTQSRLYLARGMYHAGEIDGSLNQYETLVEQMGVMEDTTSDLLALSQGDPANPRIRRLLGDAYMRQGYLQEALDAYRGALDNL